MRIEEPLGVGKERALDEADADAPLQGDEDANDAVVFEHSRTEGAARLPPLDDLHDLGVGRVDEFTELGHDDPALVWGGIDDGVDVAVGARRSASVWHSKRSYSSVTRKEPHKCAAGESRCGRIARTGILGRPLHGRAPLLGRRSSARPGWTQ